MVTIVVVVNLMSLIEVIPKDLIIFESFGYLRCVSDPSKFSNVLYVVIIRRVPAQDILFALILWYIAKTLY